NYISDIENDARPGASVETYKKIADAFNVSFLWLLQENEDTQVLDAINILLADRPLDVQKNALELIEVHLKGIDLQQTTKDS
ncbi:helix-turn-helix domain-containing protein, partial [Bacillus sp. REN16]|uniref:helix-turn-helix domain-containing protein n=1 Tax=Bacillus sp. REN16 TaxID=2887296 RepID=UPI001E2F609B